MIESLYIENFAIIDQVQIDFQSGMTVLTGETGAGKSIIIDAIGQLIGQRSQPSFVKNGADYAFIEGVFSSNKEIDKILLDNNFPIDEHLVISKKINHDGKSAIKINYRNSSQLLLKKIMSQIVDIHSQFETHQLFNDSYHLKLLDNFIGNELIDLKKEYLTLYQTYKNLNQKYLSLTKEELTDEQIKEKGYTKEEVNKNADKLTKENFENAKTIIEKRLENLGLENYIVRLNEETGEITMEIEENTVSDTVISNISTNGKFEVLDSESKEVLLNNSNVKRANVMYSSENSGTSVYLNIEFNKEGKSKLENISDEYKTINTTNTENATTENTADGNSENTATENTENSTNETNSSETQKKVILKINDEEITTTSFDSVIRTGSLQLTVGKASTDKKTINEYADKANNIASAISFGNLPVDYEVSQNEYILSDITTKKIQQLFTIFAIIAVIGLIIRYRLIGLLSSIAYIGFAALYLLLVRYTNVTIALEGIFGIVVILIMNYMLINKIASDNKKEKELEKIRKDYGKMWIKMIPICIMAIAFCFAKWASISSFGMVMLWGLVLMAIYHLIVTISFIIIVNKRNK